MANFADFTYPEPLVLWDEGLRVDYAQGYFIGISGHLFRDDEPAKIYTMGGVALAAQSVAPDRVSHLTERLPAGFASR